MGAKNDQGSERPTGGATTLEYIFPDAFAAPGTKSDNVATVMDNRFFQQREDVKATLFVLDSAGANALSPIRNFFLSAIAGGFSERAQVMEMYEGIDVTLLGEKPVNISFTMMLLNGDTTMESTLANSEVVSVTNIASPPPIRSSNWRDQWMYLWSNYIRASQAVKNGWRTVMIADNLIIEGLLMSYEFTEDAINDKGVTIRVQMLCDPSLFYSLKIFGNADIVPDNLGQVGKDVLAALNKNVTNISIPASTTNNAKKELE